MDENEFGNSIKSAKTKFGKEWIITLGKAGLA